MGVWRIFAALAALALLLAPMASRIGEASAAVPDHHAQMLKTGHCETAPDGDKDGSTDGSCCFQLCMAVAAVLMFPNPRPPVLGSTTTQVLESFMVDAPSELATPPPRAA